MPGPLQTLGWALRPLPFMKRCRERYGNAFTLNIRRGRPWVFLCDPDDVGKVLTISPKLVRPGAGDANPLLRPLLGEQSVMLLDEPEHMTHRRFLLPAFHGERMRAYEDMMVEVAGEQIDKWPKGEPFALWPQMQAISNEVVMRAVFGTTEGADMAHLRVLLARLTDWLNKPSRLTLLTMFGARWLERNADFRAVIAPVEAALLQEVRRRRATPASQQNESILSLLERAHDESGSPMTDREIRDELITLLSDGPTATSLSWAFECLLHHPAKLARLREEILAGEDDAYADAVVKEVLRLCPAVPLVLRGLVEPTRLGGHTIPADTMVAPCIYLIHHDANIYVNPYSFSPERFLAREPENYTWLPFGSGVRRCVAAVFAQLEIKRVMQTVIRHVELTATSSATGRATRSSVAFAPGRQTPVIATRRSPGQAGSARDIRAPSPMLSPAS
jgi:cytochrome P450 family 135